MPLTALAKDVGADEGAAGQEGGLVLVSSGASHGDDRTVVAPDSIVWRVATEHGNNPTISLRKDDDHD